MALQLSQPVFKADYALPVGTAVTVGNAGEAAVNIRPLTLGKADLYGAAEGDNSYIAGGNLQVAVDQTTVDLLDRLNVRNILTNNIRTIAALKHPDKMAAKLNVDILEATKFAANAYRYTYGTLLDTEGILTATKAADEDAAAALRSRFKIIALKYPENILKFSSSILNEQTVQNEFPVAGQLAKV